jgi:hypothetical protein
MNWMYVRDDANGIEWRWNKEGSCVRVIDGINRTLVSEEGISLVRIIRHYQQHCKRVREIQELEL